MPRCRCCLTPASPESDRCPVCGVIAGRSGKDFSPEERKVRFHARLIRAAAMLHLIGAGITLLAGFYAPIPPVAIAGLFIINITLAFGLARFSFWAYRAATVYYFLLGIAHLVSVQLPAVLLVLVLLYIIGNSSAKAIFERRTQTAGS